ncbi:MAG: FAD/FMN-containing dehydrogenase [Candidatus Ozemobacter sibiricus]|uniref:FAD/FMN-containing dehydrogenase n=1 Tax=Candidatus Ozemobacter sibiricus TaxID=2268124 RepID=A0A367ZSY9_9BACT|nr:MAG: FAD/FMN-containing dehydrogenase [Candidatus Ozemobacter sibiricus]
MPLPMSVPHGPPGPAAVAVGSTAAAGATAAHVAARPPAYQPVTPALLDELRGIVGPAHVIAGDPEKLEAYSHDEIAEPEYARMPECVVRPGSAAEIAAIMKLANRERVPVTPRGAGSGLSGGAVPVHGGIVLLTDRLNKVLEFDRANLTITVEPGVITNEINPLVREAGLFFAGYPMSLESCSVGGNVAENAGGGKAVKYGVTGRYVTGLELVTPTGEIVTLGGKLSKDVTGYNLIQLMVGSEGTLGIFTKITLKLMPLPKASADLLVLFPSAESAIAAVPRIIAGGGILPTALEFMDRTSFMAACEYLNETLDYQQAGAMLLITVDGATATEVEAAYEAVGEQCLQGGALEVYVADNHTTSERVWKIRRNIAEAFKVRSPRQSLEDIVVPIAAIPAMVTGLLEIARKWDIEIPCYGHAGDGNLHATPVMNPAWTDAEWHDRLPRILEEIFTLTARLGGTLSGEHGIGHKRLAWMPLFCSPAHLEMMRAIKLALDPHLILNPGKIIPPPAA